MPSTVASGRRSTTTDSPSLAHASTPCVFANAYGMRATSVGSSDSADFADGVIGLSMTTKSEVYFVGGGTAAGCGTTPAPGGNGTAMPCIAGRAVSSGNVVSGQNQ